MSELANIPIWVTKNKRRISVNQMDGNHLVNTLRMLQRHSKKTSPYISGWIDILQVELDRRMALPELVDGTKLLGD